MKERILLVDDNEEFLDSTKDVLETAGYRVDIATNGLDALNRELNEPFDVVLMDIRMPGMNGVETFIRMKENNPDVRAILFTAYALENLIEMARQEGVCEVLNKPLDMAHLLRTIDRVKKSRRGGCILVADDDLALCDNLFDVLTQRGYQVAVAVDGPGAVSQAETTSFDLLLLDMKLPRLNGLQVYRRVKALHPNLITIIITGYVEEMRELIDQTLRENACTCLAKPFKLEKLVALLDEINENRYKGVLPKKDR